MIFDSPKHHYCILLHMNGITQSLLFKVSNLFHKMVKRKFFYLTGFLPIPTNFIGPKNDTLENSFESSKMIMSRLLRMNQTRWFYFPIFLICSYSTKVENIEKSQSYRTTDKGFLEQWLVILFRNRMDSILYMRKEGNKKRREDECFFLL